MMNWFTWTTLEIAANIFTATCIFLAGRNSIHTWLTGLIGCTLYGVMFYNVQLYADATLQVFFFITGVYGWMMWTGGADSEEDLPVNYADKPWVVSSVVAAIAVAAGYGSLLHYYTDAYAPWVDSLVLTFSVVAQMLLMSRSIQTWHVWLLVNTLSVPLFWSRELYLTSIMYGFFWVNALVSLYNWKKIYTKQ